MRVCYFLTVQDMKKSVTVSTVAGSGKRACSDGIGTAAAFDGANDMVYSRATDTLMIAEEHGSRRVRCMSVPTGNLRATLDSVLMESGAMSIAPLISMIHDYAGTDCTFASGRGGHCG